MNIILDESSTQPEKNNSQENKETVMRPNLFTGSTEAKVGEAKFPEWDIIPSSQFINPRIKTQ